ncbi:MAG: hypothetical protein HOI66_03485 [Verrucomicrobia bacterium]|jgi:hypothetical protein|nr:hypothetical protein [Verrucomicrobiota bacterium]
MSEHVDAYRIPSGHGLDLRIHQEILGLDGFENVPAYSTDDQAAKLVLKSIRKKRSRALATGTTHIKGGTWHFARYGSDPSTSTEVLSESFALSICRLALVIESQD